MKDASHALNSGLAFSSSSWKCHVFKMIYCHAVRWGEGPLGNGLREDCWAPAGALEPGRGRLRDGGGGASHRAALGFSPHTLNGGKMKTFLKALCKGV